MLAELTEKAIRTIRDAARRLTGAARREFEAAVAIDYCQGSPRRAETVFGWGRATVRAGLDQWPTGVGRQDQFFPRGRRKTEEKVPDLEKHIRCLVEPDCQVDPKFQSPFLDTRMTAKAVGRAFVEKAGYRATELPTERTCRRLLNRLGFRLRRVQKTKPHKKIKETDASFANVRHAHDRAAWDEGCLRISMDGKAKVKVGEFSRGGRSRGTEARKACDHDMNAEAILNSLEAVLAWARTMTWKGIPPIVRLLENVYSKGVRLRRQAMQPYANRLRRSPSLSKWSVDIFPLIAPPV